MNPQSMIVLLILIAILVPAVKSSIVHLKGEGSCCGGPKEKARKKVIKGEKRDEWTLSIEGMHCVNCKNRIQNRLNELDGVTANVNLEKKQVKIAVYKEVAKDSLIKVIEDLGYTVV